MKTFQNFTAEARQLRIRRGGGDPFTHYDDGKRKPIDLSAIHKKGNEAAASTQKAKEQREKANKRADTQNRMNAAGRKLGLPEENQIDELFITRKSAEEKTDEKRKKKVAELIRLMKHAKDPSSDVAKKPVAKEELEIDEGMTMKDFKKQRSRQKQKDKRQAEKTSPTRRVGIHNPSASPERAARHRANVDPDFEGNDERNYPGGVTKSPKKIRKQKAVGEIN